TVALNNVTVTKATTGIFANNNSTITISGGSFDGKTDGVYAKEGSAITLDEKAAVTSSDGYGLHAEGLAKITKTKGAVSGKQAALFAEKGGKIDATNVALTTTDNTGTGAKADGADSMITLKGTTTIEKVVNGLDIQNAATVKMTDGSITASQIGALFNASGSDENKNTLENVQISSSKDDALIDKGISAEKSTVALNNVTVTKATTGIFANNNSTITVSGGSFDSKQATIFAQNGSTITINDSKITSSDNTGLRAKDNGTIKMTKGKVKGGIYAALTAENGGHINVTDVSLSVATGGGAGANASGPNSMIELHGTEIDHAFLGLYAEKNAIIKMTGGTITTSTVGATFYDSKNNENKLEDVTISSSQKDETVVFTGLNSQASNVTLKNVHITNAKFGVYAMDHSKIKISGGSFVGNDIGINAESGSTIALNNNVTVASSSGNGLRADGSGSKITMAGGKVTTIGNTQTALFAEKGGQIDATNVALTTDGKGTGVEAFGPDSTIELHGDTTINNTLNGLGAVNGGKITSENLTVVGGKAINDNPNEARSGVWTAGSGSEIQLTGKTTIQNFDEGLYAEDGSKIISGDLTIIGGESEAATVGVNTWEADSIVELNGKTTIQNVDVGLFVIEGSTIKTSNGAIDTNSKGLDTQSDTPQNGKKNKIEAKKVAMVVINGGHIDLTDVSATAEVAGLQFATFSDNNPNGSHDPQKYHSNEINLTNAELHAENGTGIFVRTVVEKSIEDAAAPSIGTVNLKKSKVHADVLLGDGIFGDKTSWKDKDLWDGKEVKAISNGTFTLSADQSTLEGRANIAKDRNVHFDLKNNTKWTLKISKNEKDDDGKLLDIAQRSRSDISTLNLDNSSIVFEKPTDDHYQTLHIGSGKPDTQEVYNATDDAKIYFNAEWSDGAAIEDQKTDRLLINGDVSGNTSVYVTGRLEENNVEANTSAAANIRGLSLIQVSGKAEENSFKLVNGYTTRGGLPDMYTLRAYGPDSSQGQADIAQNLFDEKNENFWDFRLQPELLGSNSGSNPDPETNIPTVALVPQTASYLVMPNALFYSGLTDMAKQNALLANIRTSVLGKEEEKQTGFFLYTYGSTGTLSSERGPLKYGYGADIRYTALQAGVTLAAIEGQNTTTHFGLVGTYGQLSFTPKDMKDAGKNTLDKWAITAYGSIQHDNGFYMDTLLSYGILKGDIGNAIIGKTAKLQNAKMLSISTTVGKEFATGMESLTFEPQAQIAYQHLMLNTIEDADNFTVDMNNPSQWLIRVGGRLTKTISTENSRPMSFYGKVNLIKTFGDDGTIHIGRNFNLDPMGPAIEGGVGINAQLSHNFSLHGDVSYQQKLQKTGISGASFSGGIRYQF
ncbi:autotransporter outer membrane beta-barrel domain-containing protein, partial [Bartonella sp. AC130YNZD]|uniref:autotransporter outer membrane beta-barrel domain-containing protein n=1 Tax=Bartonella sp. AC130YNZD TaxID=3243445 RepID=UPI0035D00981